MAKFEMTFTVKKVTNGLDNRENLVEAVQDEPIYVNPAYRGCSLYLPIIDDDEMKKFGPGMQLRFSIES